MTRSLTLACLLLAACAVDPGPDTSVLENEVRVAPVHRHVQPGAGLLLLEVTDDNHAIYQDGPQVFATALVEGAEPELIGDVPAGNTAFVYRAGKVVFVWTNPDRTQPSFGVSPLVIWSARSGPHLASQASPVGTFATTASPDGRRVVFPSNASSDGATGDLVLAAVGLGWRKTLVAGAAMGFVTGPCPPRATFVGDGDDAYPVAVYCAPGATTATLAKWPGGARRELVTEVATPPRLSVDVERERLATLLAGSRNPVTVDRHGHREDVAGVQATSVFLGVDGAVFYTTRPGASATLWRVASGRPPVHVADLRGFLAFSFGSRSFAEPPTSPDGRSVALFDAFDPQTGLANVVLTDARGGSAPVTIDAEIRNTLFGPAWTLDSSHLLYTRTEPGSAVGAMFAAGRHGNRQYSDDLGWSWLAAAGSIVAYNDNTTFDPSTPALWAADLKAVDVSRPTLAPKLIAPQANVAYFTSHQGTGVVYTTDTGAEPGLHVARVY